MRNHQGVYENQLTQIERFFPFTIQIVFAYFVFRFHTASIRDPLVIKDEKVPA